MKAVRTIHKAPAMHWVGDGFPVRSLFSYSKFGNDISPFLLLDLGSGQFEPSDKPRGVEVHPHRGFETVTIAYEGEIAHRDSGGNAGKVAAGDVQWMTAASGVVHEEMHSEEFTARGGQMEMAQLWVNLPSQHKMSSPKYQEILSTQIPTVKLGELGSTARIIAGELEGAKGSAQTFSPVNVWDLRLKADEKVTLPVPNWFTTLLVVVSGSVLLADGELVEASDLVVYEPEGHSVSIIAQEDSKVLLLSGEPLNEPISGYGPFVMNTQEEIVQAIEDYRNGLMGTLASK